MNITGKFKDGMKIGNDVAFDFEMRVADAGDLFAAEDELSAGTYKPLSFSAQVAAICLVSVGDNKGPFTIKHIARLSRRDFFLLRDLQEKAEAEGNGGSSDDAST